MNDVEGIETQHDAGNALPGAACWLSGRAQDILRTEALSGDGSVFLATHTPVEGFDVGGSHAASVAETSEQGLLAALSAPTLQHAFCVVQGEPGSGKSHLVRWLAVRWPRDDAGVRDVPILIRRSDSSLEGSLRELRDRLPVEYRSLLDRVGTRQQAAMAGRVADFVSNLANTLAPDYFETPLEDVAFCRAHDPAAIIGLPGLRTTWSAPSRIVRLLCGAEGERNSASATFDVYDVADLVHFHGEAQRRSGAAAMLLARISRELTVIETCKAQNLNGLQALEAQRAAMPNAAALTDALNRRRNRAIQNSLGVSATELKSVFIDLRRALRRDGRRLVLLLEDITAWEGLDDSLIDVLVTDTSIQTATDDDAVGADDTDRSDLCDLVSVVGVTPYYYGLLRPNYRQRITHEIRLGRAGGGQLQDVATMRDGDDRLRFVARYLAAVRTDPEELRQWGAETRHHRHRPPPNVCRRCPVRPGCHATFGEVDEVGLFPFTREAVARFYEALKARDGDMTWRTPRGLIQAVLAPTLTRAEAIASGMYPVPEVEAHGGMDLDEGLLGGATAAILRNRVADDTVRERLRRLIAFWGDRHSSETTRRPGPENGLAFASVARGIYLSFGLQFPGDLPGVPDGMANEILDILASEDDSATEDSASQPSEGESGTTGPETDAGRIGSGDAARSMGGTAARDASRVGPRAGTEGRAPKRPAGTSPPRRAPPPEEIRALLDDVGQYRRAREENRAAEIRKPSTWNELAYDLVHRVEPRAVGLDRFVFDRMFTTELVKVAGTGRLRGYHLGLPPEPWLLDGLIGLIHLRNPVYLETKPANEKDYHRRCVARCVMRLHDAVQAHAEARLPTTGEGARWEVSAAIAEVLAVRNWLRGVVAPSDPLDRQWSAILSDEPLSTTDPDSRVPAWKEVVDQTGPRQRALRNMLRKMVSVAQGDSSGYGLADAGSAVAALTRLQATGRLGARTTQSFGLHGESDLEAVLNLHAMVADKFGRISSAEQARLRDRARRISERRRGRSLSAHLERIDASVQAVVDVLPTASTPEVRAWRTARDALTRAGRGEESLRAVENALDALAETLDLHDPFSAPAAERPTRSRLETLADVARMPAGHLAAVDDAFEAGEGAIQQLLGHVRDLVGPIGQPAAPSSFDAGGLSGVREQGKALADRAKRAMTEWGGPA